MDTKVVVILVAEGAQLDAILALVRAHPGVKQVMVRVTEVMPSDE